MKTKILSIAATLLFNSAFAQNIGIGTSNPDKSSILDINSTNKGIRFPRVDDINKIEALTAGLMIYNTTKKSPNYHDGSRWNDLSTLQSMMV
jgi:hypothetical protein